MIPSVTALELGEVRLPDWHPRVGDGVSAIRHHCGQNQALPSVPVYVQAAELDAAQLPNYTIREWAHIEPDRQRVVNGDETIADGVTVVATPGPDNLHDETYRDVAAESLGRLRRLQPEAVHFSHDPTVHRSPTVWG